MTTASLTGALHQIVLEQGWRPSELSFDAGSSLIPAASQAAQGIHDAAGEDGEEDSGDQHELDQVAAEEVVRNLKETGYKLKVPRAKASYRQSNVESSIKSFKKILKASFLPGLPGMTLCSFNRVVQMSCHVMNLRPVCLLPYSSARPRELNCVSPQALRGPSHAEWTSMGARH